MKTLLAAALLAGAGAAGAEEFVLAANGPAVNLLLKPPVAPVPAAKAMPALGDNHPSSACAARAQAELAELTPFAVAQLCGGAVSAEAPVACYKASRRTDLTPIGRVTLCGAASDAEAAVGCYERSASTDLGGFLRAQLCSGAVTAEGPVACYKASRPSGELPVVGRVKLCTRR